MALDRKQYKKKMTNRFKRKKKRFFKECLEAVGSQRVFNNTFFKNGGKLTKTKKCCELKIFRFESDNYSKYTLATVITDFFSSEPRNFGNCDRSASFGKPNSVC